jgi:hypothetical protein
MSRKQKIILLAIAGVILLLAVRLMWQRRNGYADEKQWFVANLDYACVLNVDSLHFYGDNGKGFLICSLDSGSLDYKREDSLMNNLKYYGHLKFLRFGSANEVKIFFGRADAYKAGDKVLIHSDNDSYKIVREGKVVREYKISERLGERFF